MIPTRELLSPGISSPERYAMAIDHRDDLLKRFKGRRTEDFRVERAVGHRAKKSVKMNVFIPWTVLTARAGTSWSPSTWRMF